MKYVIAWEARENVASEETQARGYGSSESGHRRRAVTSCSSSIGSTAAVASWSLRQMTPR
jgi:hypothetical protein